MNDVYLAVLGKTEEQLTPSEKKFIDKNARTIVDLGKQIIG